ncbi:MICOS complex subunit MIC10-like [Zeugodacus cucurbitae]|uniref:MICOS complex subunit MIC10-like n=1 Tax=Zeugodacus cucurbitae TaxID=28588 RepID=UPI0023D8FA14|nr:MICOS complex subunit MIC10-like [Zeugodacus cucurbitae]
MGDRRVSYPEDDVGKRVDRCFTDALIKGSTGLLVGVSFSLLLLKRKTWPLLIGAGFGVGVAFKTCERHLNG